MASKKTVEINPYHPIVKKLKEKCLADPEDESTVQLANILYDSALISAGCDLKLSLSLFITLQPRVE